MMVPLLDSVVGAAVYVNPIDVVTLRPDPVDPDHGSLVKIRDGEVIRVRGDHRDVAGRLTRPPI
jgi:hypothetical protein